MWNLEIDQKLRRFIGLATCFLIVFFSIFGGLDSFGIVPSSAIEKSLALFRMIACLPVFFLILFLKHLKNDQLVRNLLLFNIFCLLSFVINLSSTYQFLLFLVNYNFGIGIYLLITRILDEDQIIQIVKIYCFLAIMHFGVSSVVNFDVFKVGKILVEDAFKGIYGEAYGFSFFMLCLSPIFFFLRKTSWVFLALLAITLLTPIIAGAGRVFIAFLFAVLIASIIVNLITSSISKSILNLTITGIVSFIGALIFFDVYRDYIDYALNYSNAKDGFFASYLENLYRAIDFDNWTKDLIGNGPGTYMSYAAMTFRPDLYYKFNIELHNYYAIDVFQLYTNTIGLFGDIGLIGFILFWKIIIDEFSFFKAHTIDLNDFRPLFLIVIFLFVYSFLFQNFDRPHLTSTSWGAMALLFRLTYIKTKSLYAIHYYSRI